MVLASSSSGWVGELSLLTYGGFMDNRATRRAKLSAFKKELRKAKFDEFENITSEDAARKLSRVNIGKFVSFYRNSIYSLQLFKRNDFVIVGIRRHDQKPSCPWTHRQLIKNFIFGNEGCAVEFMPPKSSEVDQANMYWIIGGKPVSDVYSNFGGL